VRFISKFSLLAVALLAIGFLSSSVRANDLLTGGFSLSEPTRWNNTLLPAGQYHIRLMRTESDTNVLHVQGEKQSVSLLIPAQRICLNCGNGSLNMTMRGGDPVVASMDLAGMHVNFDTHQSARQREEELAKNRQQSQKPSEQIAVHADPNN
jgi:hypothetical protein